MSIRKYLIVPQLIALSLRAPKEQQKAWDLFWRRVRRTGPKGDVLWDVDSEVERKGMLERLSRHLDRSLPIVDIGSGNGRQTRALAGVFPRAIGVDVSEAATLRAEEESRGLAGVDYRVRDMTQSGAGAQLKAELGETNAYVRGVLHQLAPEARRVFIKNIHDLCGERGALYVVESDYEGDSLDLLVKQGATATSISEPLGLCISSGLRPPAHFSEREFEAFFPLMSWERLDSGHTFLHTLALSGPPRAFDELSAFYAIVRPRRS